MIKKFGLVAIRIIFVYFLGWSAAAWGAPSAAGDNAPRGARDSVLNASEHLAIQMQVSIRRLSNSHEQGLPKNNWGRK